MPAVALYAYRHVMIIAPKLGQACSHVVNCVWAMVSRRGASLELMARIGDKQI